MGELGREKRWGRGAQGLQSWQPVGDATLPSASAGKDGQGVPPPGHAARPELFHAHPHSSRECMAISFRVRSDSEPAFVSGCSPGPRYVRHASLFRSIRITCQVVRQQIRAPSQAFPIRICILTRPPPGGPVYLKV